MQVFDLGRAYSDAARIKALDAETADRKRRTDLYEQSLTQRQEVSPYDQVLENTKLLDMAAAAIEANPAAVSQWLPVLQKAGIVRPDLSLEGVTPEQIQTAARQIRAETQAALRSGEKPAGPELRVVAPGSHVIGTKQGGGIETLYSVPPTPREPPQPPTGSWSAPFQAVGPDGKPGLYTQHSITQELRPIKVGAGSLAPVKTSKDDKPETEKDKTVSVLFGSLIGAENDIAKLAGGTTTASRLNAALPAAPLIGQALGTLQSDAFRKYESAALRWAANLLYIKSGATAPPEEVRSTYKQFFPQPGDGADTIKQKEAARRSEMENIMNTYPSLRDRYTLPATPETDTSAKSPKVVKHPSGATVEIIEE